MMNDQFCRFHVKKLYHFGYFAPYSMFKTKSEMEKHMSFYLHLATRYNIERIIVI